jgi:perosamine synthetase
MARIPVAGPWITEKEIAYVTDAVSRCWYADANVYHERFERAFAEYLGVRYAVALPSCTAAIHLALAALGVGPGDEVIVPDVTWIASTAPVSYVGATPVFADIDPETWCIAPASVEACITPRTKGVIPVDLYGGVPDYDALRAVTARQGIAVVEDAAQAIGAEHRGRRAGSLGDVGTFSFHGSKTLTTGEGGMLVTDREDVYRRVLTLRDHGRIPGAKMFWNGEVAFKYRMSNMQAALGLAQLERIEELVGRKREALALYRRELAGIPGVTLNAEPPGTRNAVWLATAIVAPRYGVDKEHIIAEFAKREIDSRPFFYPLSTQPAYAHLPEATRARQRNTVAAAISPYGVNLPSSLRLSEEDVRRVGEALREILGCPA